MKPSRPELETTLADHEAAFMELSFLVTMFARTMRDVVGRALPAVGQVGGRQAAKKMPVYFEGLSRDDVLRVISEQFSGGCEIAQENSPDGLVMRFQQCALRDVCRMRGEKIGGSACELFHSFIAGITGELLHAKVTAKIMDAGDKCLITETIV